jgi:hypothetical protein
MPWGAGVGAINLGAMQLARISRSPASGAPAAGCRSGCSSAKSPIARRSLAQLAALFFPDARSGLAGDLRFDHGRPWVGALGLVVVPACATAWMIASRSASAARC